MNNALPHILLLGGVLLLWLWSKGRANEKSITPPTHAEIPPIGRPPAKDTLTPQSLPSDSMREVLLSQKKQKNQTELTPPPIQISKEFKTAFSVLENTNKNVFLTGKAGTGKSTFLQYFRAQTKKIVAVVAPTGIAAINVRGQTIHSFFNFRPGFMEPGKPIYAKAEKRKIYKSIEVLIIDEISMVRADLFDAIDSFLRLNGKEKDHPFGGVQLCVVGDLYQLPPVVTKNDADVYNHFYRSPYFFDSKAYLNSAFKKIELTTIYRQAADDQTAVDFIDFLNLLRENKLPEERLSWFNRKAIDGGDEVAASIILTTTNRIADHTNQRKLELLPPPEKSYRGTATGSFLKEGQALPAPLNLELKVGAQIMFVKNDKEKKWVNGTLGVVKELGESSISVDVSGKIFEVVKNSWEDIRFQYDHENKKVVEVVVGGFEQFPLQLAWAITIHKSQGKTFDNAVIDLGGGAFSTGQAYVALSRCRKLEGVKLKSELKMSDIMTDERIVEFCSMT